MRFRSLADALARRPSCLLCRCLLVASLLLGGAMTARADTPEDPINPDRPGIADGSTVIGPRRFQIETGIQYEKHVDSGIASERVFLPSLLRFGLSRRWELRLEGNTFTHTRTAQSGLPSESTDDLAPLSLGAKVQFQSKNGKNPSLGAIFRLFPASGTGSQRSRHAQTDLRLAGDWDLNSRLSLNANLGVAVYEDGDGSAYGTGLAAATLGYTVNARVGVFVDGGLQTQEETAGKTSLILDAGITYLLNRNLQMDFSLGTGALGHTTPHPFLGFGLSARF